jgi:hypothetical protein
LREYIIIYSKVGRTRRYFENAEQAFYWALDNMNINSKSDREKLIIIGGERVWDEPSKKS